MNLQSTDILGGIQMPAPRNRSAEDLRLARARATTMLTVIFWSALYPLMVLSIFLSGRDNWLAVAAMRIPTCLAGIGFCYVLQRLLSSPRFSSRKARFIVLGIAAPIAAEAFGWITFLSEWAIDPKLSFSKVTWSELLSGTTFWTFYYLAWAGLFLALQYSFDVHEEERRSAELREQAHQAQLRALHLQINPHFLFNSLNSVAALILQSNVEKAEEMVLKLARFLRLGLASDPTARIPLVTELKLQRSYLQIEQLRFSDLVVRFDISPKLARARVPALILQPIVENAVKYGVSNCPPPAWITIRAWAESSRLNLEVTDSGKGREVRACGTGIGLANVKQRLSLLYGEQNSNLMAGRSETAGYRVHLTIPLEYA